MRETFMPIFRKSIAGLILGGFAAASFPVAAFADTTSSPVPVAEVNDPKPGKCVGHHKYKITFTGKITSTAAGVVKYHWFWFPGPNNSTNEPSQSVNFRAHNGGVKWITWTNTFPVSDAGSVAVHIENPGGADAPQKPMFGPPAGCS